MASRRSADEPSSSRRYPAGEAVVERRHGQTWYSWRFKVDKYPSIHVLIPDDDDGVLLYRTDGKRKPWSETNPPGPMPLSHLPLDFLKSLLTALENK